MLTLMIAAAAAATQPAAPAQANPKMQHEQHMQMDQSGDKHGMDCCKECCKDMAARHEGHASGQDDQAHH